MLAIFTEFPGNRKTGSSSGNAKVTREGFFRLAWPTTQPIPTAVANAHPYPRTVGNFSMHSCLEQYRPNFGEPLWLLRLTGQVVAVIELFHAVAKLTFLSMGNRYSWSSSIGKNSIGLLTRLDRQFREKMVDQQSICSRCHRIHKILNSWQSIYYQHKNVKKNVIGKSRHDYRNYISSKRKWKFVLTSFRQEE